MKKLEDFKKNEVSLKSIWGSGMIQTAGSTTKNSDGCTVKTSDYFFDKNGNGTLDKGETVITCETIEC